jgi:hypothetical protein
MKPANRSAATVRPSISVAIKVVVLPNRRSNEGTQTPIARSVASELVTQGTTYSAEAAANSLTPTNTDLNGKAPEPTSNKRSTDGDVVTLITTVQNLMTALKTAEADDARFTVVVKALYVLMGKKGGGGGCLGSSCSTLRVYHNTPDPSSPLRRIQSGENP